MAKCLLIGYALIVSFGAYQNNTLPAFNNISDAKAAIPPALQSLVKNPSAASLSSAFEMCIHIPVNKASPTWTDDRDFKLISLCDFLSLIDMIRDPNFNPRNPGVFLEPEAPQGVISGQSPESVTDPVLREKYLKSIAEHTAKLSYSNLQNYLIRFRSDGTAYTARYIRSHYSPNERNQRLKDLIQSKFKSDPKSSDMVLQLLQAVQ